VYSHLSFIYGTRRDVEGLEIGGACVILGTDGGEGGGAVLQLATVQASREMSMINSSRNRHLEAIAILISD